MLSIVILFVLRFFSANNSLVSAQSPWTTHSPLTAFKQLGFENGYQGGSHHPKQPPYIPYSISDFSDPPPAPSAPDQAAKPQNKQSLADGFQQIRHPNDILSNMGVDLPPEEILGKLKIS